MVCSPEGLRLRLLRLADRVTLAALSRSGPTGGPALLTVSIP